MKRIILLAMLLNYFVVYCSEENKKNMFDKTKDIQREFNQEEVALAIKIADTYLPLLHREKNLTQDEINTIIANINPNEQELVRKVLEAIQEIAVAVHNEFSLDKK